MSAVSLMRHISFFGRALVLVCAELHLAWHTTRSTPRSWFVPRALAFVLLLLVSSTLVRALLGAAVLDQWMMMDPAILHIPGMRLCLSEVRPQGLSSDLSQQPTRPPVRA
jgi:hypothetical protein